MKILSARLTPIYRAIFITIVVSMASAETFPVRKYVNGTIAIVSNHTQIMASRAAFTGDVWLSRLDSGKGGYLMDTIRNISKNTHKLNNTLISIKAQLRPVGCVANNTKSALFNFTTNEYFNCTCKTGWVGEDCASPQNPIPNANWKAFVDACLAELGAGITGECTSWASGNNYGTMPNWDVSRVSDLKEAFKGYDTFNADISKWDTSSVTTMQYMFYSASAFNHDIGSWNTGKVTTMYYMFGSASAFNQDIGSWNTAQVTDMGYMFLSASAFNHDIGSWNTGKVTTMGHMFNQASAFNQYIWSWNTAQVTDMYGMFYSASAFNQDIGSWDTEKVTTMNNMFYRASVFNQDIGNWNTEKVTDMFYMFYEASAFNQNISSWTGTAATTAQGSMFSGATAFQNKFTCTNAITGPASSCVPK